ncbi:MAG: SGNH/GDSL hydrolase family protein [Clostridia bacterium]|nr:SGNH/GDSL hydrolase family protein [Clostridia bacterium]
MCITVLLCVAILAATVGVLAFVQALVMPKYMTFSTREGALIGEYYNETTQHDVIFVGDCEVYESFTPPTLWEKYGITSYIRGSAQQLIWQSYYLLEETFERESPKVVVFNVLAMKYAEPQDEAYNRMTLDGMKWSQSKIDAIKASMTEEESFLSYVFPLLRFHSRWSELTAEDWKYLFSRDTVSHNGYLMQTGVVPKTSDREVGATSKTISDTCFDYLERMRVLCEENGAELILIKAPTNNWRYHWYDAWDTQVREYAAQKGLAYYNFIGNEEEIGIDWTTDTYDAGIHLNVYGAEKLTSYFGEILQRDHGVPDRREDEALSRVWEDKLAAYQKEKKELEEKT